jgi:hypothetical protein
MSIYVDLLTRALGDADPDVEPRSIDHLQADVVHMRSRLLDGESRRSSTPSETLARELAYDGALIRLCEALNVSTTPAQFASPAGERARLERALADRGVTLAVPA